MQFNKSSAAAVSIMIMLIVMFPIKENWSIRPMDNFPTSYYPMFSKKRGETYTVNYFIGLDGKGNRYILPYYLAGSGGFNQTRRQINKAVRKGRGKSLVKKVARRVANRATMPYTNINKVQLVRGTFNIDAFFLDQNLTPEEESIIASKKVKHR